MKEVRGLRGAQEMDNLFAIITSMASCCVCDTLEYATNHTEIQFPSFCLLTLCQPADWHFSILELTVTWEDDWVLCKRHIFHFFFLSINHFPLAPLLNINCVLSLQFIIDFIESFYSSVIPHSFDFCEKNCSAASTMVHIFRNHNFLSKQNDYSFYLKLWATLLLAVGSWHCRCLYIMPCHFMAYNA